MRTDSNKGLNLCNENNKKEKKIYWKRNNRYPVIGWILFMQKSNVKKMRRKEKRREKGSSKQLNKVDKKKQKKNTSYPKKSN